MKSSLLLHAALLLGSSPLFAQQPPPAGPEGPGPGGPGGPMMGMRTERKLVAQFDKDGDARLDQAERTAAREFLKANPAPTGGGFRGGRPQGGGPPNGEGRPDGEGRPPGGGRGGPGGGFGPRESEPVKPGIRISPADVTPERVKDLYSAEVLRTIFITFESDEWEAQLEEFRGTDVEVPATLTVDGKDYPGAGLHFRGASSYMMARTGQKRSLNISLDHTVKGQRLDGYKTLTLNNSFGDASLLSAVVYSQAARNYIPAPKVNLVRVVINGENWGVYVNQQFFNKDFVQENFRTGKGARWKVPGSPRGQGGLDYLGDEIDAYKSRYEMKEGTDEDWKALIQLCKVLAETPADQLEAALEPLLDVDGVLWFLALECAFMNSDAYFRRASDYSIYRDKEGRFHVIPHDMNEAFRPEGGRPGAEAGGDSGLSLDPLIGLDAADKPLRSKLLKVPALRERYLAHVGAIARDQLDWKNLGPVVAKARDLIKEQVTVDTRKNFATATFETLTANESAADAAPATGRGAIPYRAFADGRRAFLLGLPEVQAALESLK